MPPFKRKTKATAKISLNNTTDGLDRPRALRFLTNQIIYGDALFRVPGGATYTHVRVVLKGVIKYWR